MATRYDLNSQAFVNHPYLTYERLLTDDPIYWGEENHNWYISRYDDVIRLFKDPRLSSNRLELQARSLSPEGTPDSRAHDGDPRPSGGVS